MGKKKDLTVFLMIYVLAFVLGWAGTLLVEGIFLEMVVFDLIATVVTFVFSCICRNSSVYDAYWSVAPMVMAPWILASRGAFSFYHVLFLLAFEAWGLRLTLNWVEVTTGFSYEDWRYTMFRGMYNPFVFFFVNFFGIHFFPTVLVFLGLLPVFQMAEVSLGPMVIPGLLVILMGVSFEFFADRSMHAFLKEGRKGEVCRRGLWKYSRHPNYLGETTVWTGVFLTALPYALDAWWCIIGPLSMVFLFNVVSIPMMEKRQMERRPDYKEYRKTTSRFFLYPPRRS